MLEERPGLLDLLAIEVLPPLSRQAVGKIRSKGRVARLQFQGACEHPAGFGNLPLTERGQGRFIHLNNGGSA